MATAPTTRQARQAGFSITEVVVALLVTVVGVLSMASLMGYGTRLQTTARDVTIAASAGRQEFERLRTAAPLAAKRSLGGSLDADVADHFAVVQTQGMTFRCRWRIVNGPAGSREVAMVVLPPRVDHPLATIGGRLWP